MQRLNYEIKGVCNSNRHGSHGTQVNRFRILKQAADDLHRLGYRKLSLSGVKQKHIQALVDDWHKKEINCATMKNRMSVLRWLAAQTNRPSLIAKDEHLRMSLRLQVAFGLRREEALKFSPSYADRTDRVVLKASWCKGGRSREIPIRNDAQRAVLDQAHKLAGRGSMIPAHRRYIDQLKLYEYKTGEAGMNKMHGLRHQFAQDVYKELTGRDAPAVGGLSRKDMSKTEKAADDVVRLQISEMLGHGRVAITKIFLGS